MNAALLTAPGPALAELRISGLTVSYGAVHALADVDLRLAPGELVALAGEPGAGKTTVVRCIAGDIAPTTGRIEVGGEPVPADPAGAARRGIAVVWQDLALCENLDVASNLLLGLETPRLMSSDSRFHAMAVEMLAELRIPISDTTRVVRSLSSGQRQLLAITRAVSRRPRLLVLDEPTATLGAAETAQIEELIATLRDRGTTILLVSSDREQMYRIADRIVVLRQGGVVAELDPRTSHPDDLPAVQSGQQVDTSARRQLNRLHGLADSLVSADPSSSLSLILSALGSALHAAKVCIHVADGQSLACAASLGLDTAELAAWGMLELGPLGGPPGEAALRQQPVIDEDRRLRDGWARLGSAAAPLGSSWSAPVLGPSGVSAVITVFRDEPGVPHRDELDLLTLYAGYASGAIERDRLLDQVTARNRVLETIREMLQTFAGPVTVSDGLHTALHALRRGLRADEVALLAAGGPEQVPDGWRAYSGTAGDDADAISDALAAAALQSVAGAPRDGVARAIGGRVLAVTFNAPGGPTMLLARWEDAPVSEQDMSLIEDAAHSLRLALEREEAALAHQEAAALRRSRELQRGFLSRLSHELRTPLTAIRGYASSLLAPDVTWDPPSEERFLGRIAAESSRLGRLVDDLLDFSAIEAGVMRLQRDWCDVRLVVEAAVSCLPDHDARAVSITCDESLPSIWADHDRLEQVFVNLLTNAFRHNPEGTRVTIAADELAGVGRRPGNVEIRVIDDGAGFPEGVAASPFEPARRHRSPNAGAGIGLSIARGIVEAHGGEIDLAPAPVGAVFRIRLPIEADDAAAEIRAGVGSGRDV
jgi:signal transduction histidine kinase/ABC-type multidrug transport system ATPase subunit